MILLFLSLSSCSRQNTGAVLPSPASSVLTSPSAGPSAAISPGTPNPEAFEKHLLHVRSFLDKEDYDGALKEFEKYAAGKKNDPHIGMARGMIYLRMGEYEKDGSIEALKKAIEEFERYKKSGGSEPELFFYLGTAYLRLGENTIELDDLKKSSEYFDMYEEHAGENPVFYLFRGSANFRVGELEYNLQRFNNAIRDLDNYYRRGGDDRDGYLYRGSSLFYRGEIAIEQEKDPEDNLERAIKELTLYLKLGGNFRDAYLRRGFSYYYQGHKELAVKDLNRWMDIVKDTRIDKEYEIMGQIYIMNGKYDKAVETLNYGIKHYPDDFAAFFRRGEAYYYMGDYHKARGDLDKALSFEIDNSLERKKIKKLADKVRGLDKSGPRSVKREDNGSSKMQN